MIFTIVTCFYNCFYFELNFHFFSSILSNNSFKSLILISPLIFCSSIFNFINLNYPVQLIQQKVKNDNKAIKYILILNKNISKFINTIPSSINNNQFFLYQEQYLVHYKIAEYALHHNYV